MDIQGQDKQVKHRPIRLIKDQEAFLAKNRYGINQGYILGRTPLRSIEVERKFLRVTVIPVPSLDPTWKINNLHKSGNRSRGRKNNADLSQKKIAHFRDMAFKTPGTIRLEVNKLIRKYPKNENLYMVSGISTYLMLKNSVGEGQDIIDGMQLALRDATAAILTNGITLFNLKAFFEVYFGFLEKLVVIQKRAWQPHKNELHYGTLLKNIDYAVQIVELLAEKNKEAFNLIGNLTKNFNKTSIANPSFEFLVIKRAMDYLNAGMGAKKMDQGTADQVVEWSFAIVKVLSKIPILEPIVQELIRYLSSSKTEFRLQYVSILSNRFFFEFKLNMILRELDKMRAIGRKIFTLNRSLLANFPNRSIQKNFEFEPYLNIALITEFALNLFKKSEQELMLSVSYKLLERVTLLDHTEKRIYMKEASDLMRRLDHLLDADNDLTVDHSIDPFKPAEETLVSTKKKEKDAEDSKKSAKEVKEPEAVAGEESPNLDAPPDRFPTDFLKM